MSVTIEIDGRQLTVPEGMNLLEAALQNGIYIPHLCHHPDLPDLGSCRLCIVEVEGKEGVQPSCKLKASEGMKVITDSPRIHSLRKLAMELLLAAHPEDCSTCPKYGRCELQTLIQYMGVSATRMSARIKGFAQNDKNPLLIHDMNRCVLCGRCVRACGDLRGVGVLQYNKKELETYVGTLHDKLLTDADCRFCGACAEVCPTGTIRDLVEFTPVEKKDTLIPCQATCPTHTDVPRYVRLAKEGRWEEALAVVHERLPFPECLGRVCAHPCESNCRRGEVNEPVSIRNIKRYAAEHAGGELWKKNSKHLPVTGKRVCVVGGGNVAFDCARTARRLGAEEIHLACLEAREKMTADEEEIEQAQEEGIQIHPAHTFEAILGPDRVSGVRFCNVKSFTFDENRRAVIVKEENSEHVIEADTVIFAVGQRTQISPEAGLELGRGNSIAVQPGSLRTSVPGIYACGDAVYGTRTVIQAVAAGRDAASEIDKALGGSGDISEVLAPVEMPDAFLGRIEGFGHQARQPEVVRDAALRENNFDAVSFGLADEGVRQEAGRCLQCDLRFTITPPRIWSDYDQNGKEAQQ